MNTKRNRLAINFSLAVAIGMFVMSAVLTASGQDPLPWRVWQKDYPCSGRFDWVVVSQQNPGGSGGLSYFEVFPGSHQWSTRAEAQAEADADRFSPRFESYCCRDYSVWKNNQTGQLSVVRGQFGPGVGWRDISPRQLCCEEAWAMAGFPNAATCGATLSGVWIAEGYTCNGTTYRQEQVSIEQTGQTVVATKITGDDCIAAGDITWRGTFTGNSFTGQMQFGNRTSKHFENVAVAVKSSELLTVSGNGWTITYRKTTAAPPKGVNGKGAGNKWNEEEADWKSVWVRRGNSNVFDANYTGPDGQHATTVNTVTVDGNSVFVKRTSSTDNNLCSYSGTIAADGVTIVGTYICPRGGTRTWRARIIL